MSGSPAFWARMLRQQSGIGESRQADLEHIVGWAGIHLAEIPIKGFLGLHMCVDGQHGIMLKAGQWRGQRRFTLAHELGHFAIPQHAQSTVRQCLEDDLSTVNVQSAIEREANEFAAELLMPRKIFVDDIRDLLPSFRHAIDLASPSQYDVSVTACALRWIELSTQPCALVCIEEGRIKWKWLNKHFRYALPPRGHAPLPESLAGAVLRGEAPPDCLEAVPPWAWIEVGGRTPELLESAFTVPSIDQVLSILVLQDEDREDDDD